MPRQGIFPSGDGKGFGINLAYFGCLGPLGSLLGNGAQGSATVAGGLGDGLLVPLRLRDHCLDDDGPGVNTLIGKMDGAARELHSVLKALALNVKSRE